MQSETRQALDLVSDFADRTGLTGGPGSRRYLWTDAFALINALDLYQKTQQRRWRFVAIKLIADVHGDLGRYRPDDAREGWLSGLGENEGICQPTRGGLRIGKPLPERSLDEPYDAQLEWDRDGQYWHYLTKWMDALSRASVVLGNPHYQLYAKELAESTFPRFLRTSDDGHPVGLAWKMSVDLSRPQIPNVSPHDALDGYVTFQWLGRTGSTTLSNAAAILLKLSDDQSWTTVDPLGLGGLLLDALRLALLPDRTVAYERLLSSVLEGVDQGLSAFARSGNLAMPASRRLGFRELGLAIGLQTLTPISAAARGSESLARMLRPYLDDLRQHEDIGKRIITFWSAPENRCAASWMDHRDINEMMLATALLGAFVHTAELAPQRSAPVRA